MTLLAFYAELKFYSFPVHPSLPKPYFSRHKRHSFFILFSHFLHFYFSAEQMHQSRRETNPHFHPSQPPTRPRPPVLEFSPSPPPQGRRQPPPWRQGRPLPPPERDHDPNPRIYTPPPPPPPSGLPQQHKEPNPQQNLGPTSRQPHPVPQPHHATGHGMRLPENRKTNPIAWLIAAMCVLFWIIIIVGGLVTLIVYLLFRPRSPKFDISTVTLNAAYLDMGYLLNADLTVLANFTNPNSKVNIDFSYVVFDLFYDEKQIATQYIEPFSVQKHEYRFAVVHLVSSQVRLQPGDSLRMQTQIGTGRVNFEIRGLFRAKSKLGGFFRYSYWLHAQCKVVLGAPPTGVLMRKQCETKH